jgi:hypothetical protein
MLSPHHFDYLLNIYFNLFFFFKKKSLRSCAGNAKSVALRTAALRALAHFCRSDQFVRSIGATGIDYFIVGSLEREATAATAANKLSADGKSNSIGHTAAASRAVGTAAVNLHHSNSAGNVPSSSSTASSDDREMQVRGERIAALKLVMRMIEHGVESMPRSLLQSLVAISEAPGDLLRRQCLRSLCEVLLRAPRVTAAANGVRTLVNSILDHSLVAQQPALVGVLVFLLDSPDTRQLVRANDVALLLAPLCATYRGRDQLSDEERVLWRASLHSIVLLARSWAGLVGMSSGPVGLKAAVAALALPIGELHDDVINAFYRIFDHSPPRSADTFNIEAQIREYMHARVGRGAVHDVVRCFHTVQLLAFDAAGGLTALAAFASHKPDNARPRHALVRRKATQLLAELLAFAGRNLSRSECMRLNLMPGLVRAASAVGSTCCDSFNVLSALSEHAKLELDMIDYVGLDHALEGKTSSIDMVVPDFESISPMATLRSPRRSTDGPSSAGSTLRRGLKASLVAGMPNRSTASQSQIPDDQLLRMAVARENEWRRPVVSRKLERVGDVRARLDASVDEIAFRQRIDRTHVLDTKEPGRWDWAALYDVVDGPLALHINYALNKTKKFARRVLAFFTPSASRDASLVVTPATVVAAIASGSAPPGLLSVPSGHPFAFALLPLKPENVLYLRVICRLIEVLLLASEAGKTLLKQHKLLQEIATLVGHEAQCLRSGSGDDALDADLGIELDQDDSDDSGDDSGASPVGSQRPSRRASSVVQGRLLSSHRLARTMSRHYFTILGAVSSTHRGLELMKKFQLFERLKELLDHSRSDDMSMMIITSLDYDMAGDSRQLLSAALMTPSPTLRLVTVRHLRQLLRQRVQAFALWGVDLLLLGVADRDRNVQREALEALDEALDDAECAEYLIGKPALVPTLQALGESGIDLLLRFLTAPAGYELLEKSGFVSDRLREDAIEQVNLAYARRFATLLDSVFADTPQGYVQRRTGVSTPRHFLGQLASSLPGCRVLMTHRRVLDRLAEVVREAADDIVGAVDSDDSEYAGPRFTPLQRRAALLALAHVGSSRNGFALLTRLGIDAVALVAPLADGASSLSMRGVAYYALCMFVGHIAGRRRLVECGWICAEQRDAFVCIPNRTARGVERRARLLERPQAFVDYESANEAGSLTKSLSAKKNAAADSDSDSGGAGAAGTGATGNASGGEDDDDDDDSSELGIEAPAKPRRRRRVVKKRTKKGSTKKKRSSKEEAAVFPAVPLPLDEEEDLEAGVGDDEMYLEELAALDVLPGQGDLSVLEFGANGLDALGGALHNDADRLGMLTMPAYAFTGSAADAASSDVVASFDSDDTAHRRRAHVLRLVVKLSNRVVQKDAFKSLERLKAKAPHAFTSPYLLFQIFKLFETYRFPLEQRRQVHQLFSTVSFNAEEFFKDYDKNAHDLVFYDEQKIEQRLALDEWEPSAVEKEAAAFVAAPGAAPVAETVV